MNTVLKSFLFTIAAGVALASTAAQAVTVERIAGTVRVNKGTGFVTVGASTDLRPGDTIMVDGKGKARLVYADGCSVPVKAGSLARVGEVSPCSMTAQAPNAPPPPPGPFPFLPGFAGPGAPLAAIGLLGAAGVGIGVAVSSSHNNANSFPLFALAPTSP